MLPGQPPPILAPVLPAFQVGIYKSEDDTIPDAQRRTVTRMASLIGNKDNLRALVIGSGHSDATRFLARSCGYQVVTLGSSPSENERARALNKEQGIDERVEVVDAPPNSIPYTDSFFDVVWSQDSMCKSANRALLVGEIARVLKYRGSFVFADPMQSDSTPPEALDGILGAGDGNGLGSPGFYRHIATKAGMHEDTYSELTPHLASHCATVIADAESRCSTLSDSSSQEYLESLRSRLQSCIDATRAGHLLWGIFAFRKIVI